ncbi:hypothetical protein ASF44_30325 [Pseudorhodoferax sp. Leaf274]|nr:hypothetical protein ASF44_30325 [Pseudorhodoferax sp. Leaf274]
MNAVPHEEVSGGSDDSAASAAQVYLWDRREIEFLLWELFHVDRQFLGTAPYQHTTRAAVDELFARAQEHAKHLAQAFYQGDRDPARLQEDGEVHIPAAFLPLWEEHKRDWFWLRQQGDPIEVHGEAGIRFPQLVIQLATELFAGANAAFMCYAGFTPSAATVIRSRGTELQKKVFLPALDMVRWDACFCATEPEAGSDLMAISTTARPLSGEVYAVTGEKCYITAGVHPLTENTVYLVLGRLVGGSTSPLAMSCFIVPRFWPDDSGRLVDNAVECTQVEDKMGLNGCANTRLVFGRAGVTRGYLLGNKPNAALLQLAMLMKKARIGTGAIGVAVSSSAYLHALTYARKRVQGAAFDRASDLRAPRVPIVEHCDVQRMLLEMKAKVEGSRMLLCRISFHASMIQQLVYRKQKLGEDIDRDLIEKHGRLALLYAPMAKAYISDECWNVVTQAIQVHGAVGYFRDRPLEQYARDLKILTIWEGTNYIQSQDLVRDKLGFGRQPLAMKDFEGEVRACLDRRDEHPELAPEFAAVESALAELGSALEAIQRHASAGRQLLVSQFCTRFLGMFGDVVTAWNLLEAAAVAAHALRSPQLKETEAAFYRGKLASARFFCHNLLPAVAARAQIIRTAEQSFVHIDPADFGYEA